MDGRNASGRRISLLNENDGRTCRRLPSLAPSYRSRTSSHASTPSVSASPYTPQLDRSTSPDSAAMRSPSPITPDFSYDTMPGMQYASSAVSAPQSFYPTKESQSAYPPVPQHQGSLPYPTSDTSQTPFYRPQDASVPEEQPQHYPDPDPHSHAQQQQQQQPRRTVQPTANPKSKKNQYPCPMAKQFNCPDYFTTSGHAARHAKKHTGKKDAFCPECNKAFTRKDNMEQHRRTHQTGRNSTKSSDESSSRARKVKHVRRPKPAPLQTQTQQSNLVDPSLPISPASSLGMSGMQAADPFAQTFTHQSPFPEQMHYPPTMSGPGSNFGNISPSYALDTLAEIAGQSSPSQQLQ